MLAWDTLRLLTGGRVGNCVQRIRPCLSNPCNVCRGDVASIGGLEGPCGCDSCACKRIPEISLASPIAHVWSVSIDGMLLGPSDYLIVDGRKLIRTDGLPWPSCQDMTVGPCDPGSFTIEYIPGIEPDAAGLWAAGVLACEYAKSCSGGKCRLPASVSTVSRQGMTITMDEGMFSNGLTGIREVDAYILSINPNKLKIPAQVWSPDAPPYRHLGVPR